jgi:hypothetical protein
LIIADRQALGGGIAADTPFEQRVQRRAEVGPEHQGKRGMRRHDRLGRKGHDQQHDGDTRMRRPGQASGKQNVDQRLGRDRAEQHSQTRHVLERRDHRQQVLTRDQDQTEPDPDPAEVARAGDPAAPKHEHAEQDEQKRDPRNIERQHLDDQRSADIGTQHDRQRGNEVDETAGGERRGHQPGCRAALQHRCHTQPRQKGFEAAGERVTWDAPELRGRTHA